MMSVMRELINSLWFIIHDASIYGSINHLRVL